MVGRAQRHQRKTKFHSTNYSAKMNNLNFTIPLRPGKKKKTSAMWGGGDKK